MEAAPEIRIVLFFTRGVSLDTWACVGMLAREVALYERLGRHGVQTTFVTYGDASDLHYADRIPGVRICCNQDALLAEEYTDRIAELHADALKHADVIKTNQTNGAEVALRAARRWDKPLIARCGYLWSEFAARRHGDESVPARRARQIEADVFTAAERIVVTTNAMRASITQRVPDAASRIRVVPNYVDTDRFRPAPQASLRRRRLVYIGRLDQDQKNVRSMIAAVRDLDVELELIGDGPLREEIAAEADRSTRIMARGSVPNDELPRFLQAATAFVLPSFYEGHPKALIEAMACGLAVIATDAPGIAELVDHGRTGWLCEPTPSSLRAGIERVLGDDALRTRLAQQGRRLVEERFSLDRVWHAELAVYREAIMEHKNEHAKRDRGDAVAACAAGE